MTITPNDYMTNLAKRKLADEIMASAGVDKRDVTLIEGDGPYTLTLLVRGPDGQPVVNGSELVERRVTT